MVQSDHHNISLVSKSWRIVAGECVNRGGRRPKLSLLANYIAELKSKVFALDLSNLHQVFEKLAGVQWPECLHENDYGEVYNAER